MVERKLPRKKPDEVNKSSCAIHANILFKKAIGFKKESISMEDKVSKILNDIPNISERLKKAITHRPKFYFEVDDVRQQGYQKYLSSDSAIDQIRGAAVHLADIVDLTIKENRKLNAQETEVVSSEFKKAAKTRAEYFPEQGADLLEISQNIPVLAEVMRKLK